MKKRVTLAFFLILLLSLCFTGYADAQRWDFNGSTTEGWTMRNATVDNVAGGYLFVDPDQSDPGIVSPSLNLSPSLYGLVKFRMASNCPDTNGTIYFKTLSSPNYDGFKSVSFTVTGIGPWYDYSIDMTVNSYWTGTITGIRIDPATDGRPDGEYDIVGFDWIEITSSPKPDLIVQSPNASPTTVQAGSTTYISSTVRNQGSGSAGSSYVKYYLSSNTTYGTSDTYLGSDYVSSLSSGSTSPENATVTIPSSTSTGTKYILFYADKDGSVAESNENNNVTSVAITVTPKPDLVAIRTYLYSLAGSEVTSPTVGDQVRIYHDWRVDDSSVTGPFWVKCYLDGSLFSSYQKTGTWGVGNYYHTPQETWNVTSGAHTAYCTIDANNNISESSESNNSASNSWNVPNQFDLVRGIIEIVDGNGNASPGYVGDTVYFKFNYSVQGQGTTPPFDISCDLDSSPFWSTNNITRTGGQSYVETTTSYTVQSGSHNVRCVLDVNSEVNEADENNNESSTGWTPQNPPNPQVSVSPPSGPQGTTFSEPGTGFTPNSTAMLYFNGPDGPSTYPNKATDGNGAYSHTWPCDACPVGQYSYYAVDDTSGQTSNTVYFTVYVVTPQASSESGAIGSTISQPGTGFTPGGTAELHFQRPDGSLSPTTTETVQPDGTYNHDWTIPTDAQVGIYQYWAIDLASGITSNTAFFDVTSTIAGSPVYVPLYRLYKYDSGNNTRDHFYTTNPTERDNAINTMSYSDEGVECYISDRNFTGGVPLYRLYRLDVNSHFYTTSATEKDDMIANGGYSYEGIQGFVNQNTADGLVSLHRLKQSSGTPYHYFLSSESIEYNTVINSGYTETYPNGIGYVQPSVARDPNAHGRPQGNYGEVDLGSGALRGLNSLDLIMKGRGFPLAFTHYYNSFDMNHYPYPIGPGWNHSLESSIEEDIEGNVFVKWGNGSISYFQKTGSGPIDYLDKAGNHDQLTLIDDGINYGYDIKRKNQTVYTYREYNVNPWPGGFLQNSSRILLIGITDWKGNSLSFSRDSAYGTVQWVSDGLGRKLEFEYYAPSLQLKTVKETENSTVKRSISFTYNSDGTLDSFTDARGKTTQYSYDSDRLLSSITYPRGNTVNIGYDADKKVNSFTMGNDPAASISYNPSANTTTVTDPRGQIFTYTHVNFNLTSQQSSVDLNPALFEYNDTNNPTKPTRIVDKENNSIYYQYDTMGNVTKITNALGKIADFTYNSKNNLTSSTDFHDSATTVTPTNYYYDATGNQLDRIINPESDTTWLYYDATTYELIEIKDGRGYSTHFEYDGYGNLDKVTDAENNITQYTNDYAGRTTLVVDGKLKNTDYSYDALDNLTSVMNHVNHQVSLAHNDNGFLETVSWLNNGFTSSTGYSYDSEDRLQSVTNPLNSNLSFIYNDSGSLESRNDYNNNTTTYQYDANNRLKDIIYPDHTVTIGRNNNGSIMSVSNQHGSASSFTYNALNLIDTYNDPYSKTVQYGYNDAGRIETITYPGSKIVTYGYDNAGRLKTVQDWIGGTTTYIYDGAGNLKDVQRANGTKAIYTYDLASRLTGITEQKSGGAVIASYSFVLDGVGNHSSVTATEPLTYTAAPVNVSYTIDNTSNRLLSAGTASFTYDNNGNRQTRPDGSINITYSWDYENMLTGVSTTGQPNIQYKFDGMNNRIARVVGTTETRYILDLNNDMSRVLAETDGNGNITAYYVYGYSLISRIDASGNRRFYHFNHRGDTVALTDNSENVTDKYAYDEYGKVQDDPANTTPNPFKFIGQQGVMDEGTNLYFMRARFYDADVGRFLNEDPIGFEGGDWNLYAYVGGNPVIGIDPEGFTSQRVLNAIRSERAMTEILYWEKESYFQSQIANIWEGTADALISTGALITAIPASIYNTYNFVIGVREKDYEKATMSAISLGFSGISYSGGKIAQSAGFAKSEQQIIEGTFKILPLTWDVPRKLSNIFNRKK